VRFAALCPGDIVDVVAPASRCSRLELDNGVKALRRLGLVPRVPRRLFTPGGSALFAAPDEDRLRQLKAALYAPDSKLIWCVRGGYGSLRLIPAMSRWTRPRHGKILLGYSDMTTLHSFLNQHWRWPSWHGPMLDRLGRPAGSVGAMSASERRELEALLFGRSRKVDFAGLKALNPAAKTKRRIQAPIVGGNMAVLQAGLRTAVELEPAGKILFFEDIGERPHRVDRMLTQFEQAGWFKHARAVLFGHFLLADARDRRQLWNDVISRFADRQRIPVLAGLPVGHDRRRQATLPLNTRAELHAGREGRLTVDAGLEL
jgi:muramoyltetrapeptide carboxypeptidase